MESVIIGLVLSIVKAAIKNPAKKAALKKKLLAVRDAIDAAYAGD
mgnify:CR=1 FL=1